MLAHLVIRVDDERGVERTWRQTGIGRRAENRFDVGQPGVSDTTRESIERVLRDIHRVDAPVGADRLRQSRREKAVAGAHVGDT